MKRDQHNAVNALAFTTFKYLNVFGRFLAFLGGN